ncbi:MAG TPA: copper resistance system multicopper oxidase [Gammaproteobacteria bacterium]|nr:copper resistance system multicopper oxidase [Gammaproteobacteria bacterium]
MQGLAVGGGLLSSGFGPAVLAGTKTAPPQPQLPGNRFRLSVGYQPVNFTGRDRLATAINGCLPAPVLRFKQGERVTLEVTNHLAEDSSVHWHGLILPSAMDGVPNISDGFRGIPPGETFRYQFDVTQSGTYWYHSHSGFQEQTGAYGAIVIDPADGPRFGYDREHVVLLSDWSDEDPEDIYARLKKMSHFYNTRERTMGDLWADIERNGLSRTWGERQMWNEMRMSDRDISDVTGYTYTFLMNGQSPAGNWTGLFERGEKVLLRIVNASAMTFFDFRIPGLEMTVVGADGQQVEPVTVDEFRIGVAETYDVLVEPKDDRAYTLFAQAIDRSGYAAGRLTPHPSLEAEIPPLDTASILTHGDMGMAHGSMDQSQINRAAMGHAPANQPAVDHSTMDHGQMDHSAMGHGQANPPAVDHSAMNHGTGSAGGVTHHETEYGPHIDMLAQNPQYRLDDPGVGLRNNGRRVLTYADLRNLDPTPDPREPGREIELHLNGNMRRYMWSINGIRFADAEPLLMKYGERLRITLVNDTMMNHPMHLHGMWSDLETGDDGFIPRKHTVIVQPGAKISYRVTADAPGAWAYHCHLIYHMPGMFRKVVIS